MRAGHGCGGHRIGRPHEELHNEPNNSAHEPTGGLSTPYGSGHLILVFSGIERIFLLLPAGIVRARSAAPAVPAHWSDAEKYAFKVEKEIWFRRSQKRFQFCFVSRALFQKPVPSNKRPCDERVLEARI
jgi:hypothetical protein